jgi:outer membrane protein assembly factor BamB
MVACLATLVSLFVRTDLIADDTPSASWPQWRGPGRDGWVRDVEFPDSLASESLELVWSKPLDVSYSGPIIADGKLFVTETQGEKEEVVTAFRLADGEPLWTARWPGAMSVPFFARENGDWIRSTPIYDDGRLYVAGMLDTLHCLDAASGDELWNIDFVGRFQTPVPAFGCVCSPLIRGDQLYIQAGAGLVKLDKRSGSIEWRALADEGGMNGSAFSSPTLATIGGREQLVVQGRTSLAGVDPETGEVFWSMEIEAFRGMNILTPIVSDGAVFTSAYGGKSLRLDLAAETSATTPLEPAWTNKAQGYMSTPVLIDGHLYIHLRNQRFACIELATGETKWTTTPYGRYWSLVTDGKRILALDETGMLRLIAANTQQFEQLDERQMSEHECWAHLAVAGDYVVIRELRGVSVFRWKRSS